jgi:hypothetical protein
VWMVAVNAATFFAQSHSQTSAFDIDLAIVARPTIPPSRRAS